ncbi:MAG TPA: TIGR02147 family protein [Pseudobdellovibrionaceae bacterium]|nr:TIGR02147 family protein [Pseudobdellovibrionaceae bacterium]
MMSYEILKNYWMRKKEDQPSYSLRALARDIKISPSYLSDVFSGKKQISVKVFKNLCRALEVDTDTINAINTAALFENLPKEFTPKNINKLKILSGGIPQFKPMSKKKYSLLKKWYYVAILDLMTCQNFKSDRRWIAKRLGLLQGEVDEALDVLITLDLVDIHNNIWRKKTDKIRLPTIKSQAEVRQFHKQMIEKSLDELNSKLTPQDFDRRLITGITFSCNPTELKSMKKKINTFLHQLTSDMMTPVSSEVYQVNLQLFPLSIQLKD